MKGPGMVLPALAIGLAVALALPRAASAQTWTALANQPGFTYGSGAALLLTDGTVIVHDEGSGTSQLGSDWKRLTPDSSGSYVNGTWSPAGSLQAGYGPHYFASAVLADGRVAIFGGEYNLADNGGNSVDSNQGALYNPATNSWSALAGPGWANIGDAQCAVLPDGRLMMGFLFGTQTAVMDPTTLTWSSIGTGKADNNSEEGWCLLPDGTILTVDCSNGTAAEKFDIATSHWISAGNTPSLLTNTGGLNIVPEMGPLVLRPDGTVLAIGASGHNAVYTPPAIATNPGSWAAAPDFPNIGGQLDVADGPACLLPNGNVLVGASPGVFNNPTYFYEFDSSNTLNPVPATPNAGGRSSFLGRMVMLPTGQVLYTDGTNDIEIYTPVGGPNAAWRPTISACPNVVTPGASYPISGTQFNGLSQAMGYGDDSTAATNYPLVRITNRGTGHVFYAKTHNHSTMGVATGATPVSTVFDAPAGLEGGISDLVVVANGIPSAPYVVNDPGIPTTTATLAGPVGQNGWYTGPVLVTLNATSPLGPGYIAGTFYTVDGGGTQVYAGPFTVSGDLVHTITFWSTTTAGGVEAPHPSATIKIDGTAPTLHFAPQTPPQNINHWNRTTVSISYTTADNLSGVASYLPGSPLLFTAEGFGQAQAVTVTDVAGNSAVFTTPPVNIDLTAPVTTSSLSGPAGHNGWYVGAVQVTLQPTDNLSGVAVTYYSVDGGPVTVYGGAFTVTGDAHHTVAYWSVDNAGNVESSHTIPINIDTTPPVITVSASRTTLWPPNHKMVPVTISGNASDNLSGVDTGTGAFAVVDSYGLVQPSGPVAIAADGSYSFTILLEASRLGQDKDGRTYTVTVSALDLAGNSGSGSAMITVPHDQR